jgi:hypothetical protein
VEKYSQKVTFTKHITYSFKLTNLQSFLGEYMYSLEKTVLEKAKAIYIFEKLSPERVQYLVQEVKEAAKKVNEKKYLILAGQEEINAEGKLVDYSIQEVEP